MSDQDQPVGIDDSADRLEVGDVPREHVVLGALQPARAASFELVEDVDVEPVGGQPAEEGAVAGQVRRARTAAQEHHRVGTPLSLRRYVHVPQPGSGGQHPVIFVSHQRRVRPPASGTKVASVSAATASTARAAGAQRRRPARPEDVRSSYRTPRAATPMTADTPATRVTTADDVPAAVTRHGHGAGQDGPRDHHRGAQPRPHQATPSRPGAAGARHWGSHRRARPGRSTRKAASPTGVR